MVLTPSSMIKLGTPAPDFELLDTVSGQRKRFSNLQSKTGTVVMFICNHCPFVKHLDHEIVELAKAYQTKGIAFVAISSNDVDNYPEDSPEKMHEKAKTLGYTFPYFYDETQEVAKAFDATCTPDFFVYDGKGECVYRGCFDDSKPGKDIPATGKDLKAALDSLINNEPVDVNQKPSMGCNIKWIDDDEE